jgi:hypothetical protein
MKILDLVYNILLEQGEDTVLLLNTLKENWGNDVSNEEIQKLIKWFNDNLNTLDVSKEMKKTFRKLPDGTERLATKQEQEEVRNARSLTFTAPNGERKVFETKKIKEENKKISEFLNLHPEFNSENLKDITKYTFEEINDLKDLYDVSDQEKKLIDSLSEKWNMEEKKGTVKKIVKWFNSNRDNLVPENDSIKYVNSRNRDIIYSSADAFTTDENGERKLKPGIVTITDKIKKGEIVYFLRLNPNFDINGLKDITRYSSKEIKDLMTSFSQDFFKTNSNDTVNESDYDTLMNSFSKNNHLFDSNKVRDSYEQLWKGKYNLLYENNGFRVYKIQNMAQSVAYGYYLTLLSNKLSFEYNNKAKLKNENDDPIYKGKYGQWCVTNPSHSYYTSYRQRAGDPRSFYFIIDDNRNPYPGKELQSLEEFKNDKSNNQISLDNVNYLVALQPQPNGTLCFSNISNPHPEPEISKEKLFSIFPNLNNVIEGDKKVIDLITFVKYSSNENNLVQTKEQSILTRIDDTQDPNNQYFFPNVSPELKNQYITSGGYITRAISWDSMTPQMRKNYIIHTNRNNYIERFSTKELLNAVKASNSSDLKDQLRILELTNGLRDLNKNLIIDENSRYHINKKNDKINIWVSKRGQFGILNEENFDWLFDNGITYEPKYERKGFDIVNLKEDQSKENFKAHIFKKSNGGDEDSFVEVQPLNEATKGYLFTYEKWKNLFEPKLENVQHPKTGEKTNVFKTKNDISGDFETDSNIHENKIKRRY